MQFEVVEFEEMPGNECGSWLCDCEVEGACMSLVHELNAAVRIEPIGPDFVSCDGTQRRLLVDLVVASQRGLEGVAVDDNVVVEGVQQFGLTVLRESVSMVHRVEGCPVKVDGDLPVLFSLHD